MGIDIMHVGESARDGGGDGRSRGGNRRGVSVGRRHVGCSGSICRVPSVRNRLSGPVYVSMAIGRPLRVVVPVVGGSRPRRRYMVDSGRWRVLLWRRHQWRPLADARPRLRDSLCR